MHLQDTTAIVTMSWKLNNPTAPNAKFSFKVMFVLHKSAYLMRKTIFICTFRTPRIPYSCVF